MKIISLSSLLTVSVGILVLVTYKTCFGQNDNNFVQGVDNSENCPCIPRDDCPRLYGQSAIDIRELGFIQPCQEFGTVRCCGVTIRIVQNGEEDEEDMERTKYESMENMDLEVGESTVNTKIVAPPPTLLSSLRREAFGRRVVGEKSPSTPLLNKSILMSAQEENGQIDVQDREKKGENSPNNSTYTNSFNNLTETSSPTSPDNDNGPLPAEGSAVRQGAGRVLTGGGISNQYRVKRPSVLPWKGMPRDKSTTTKPKLLLKLPPVSTVHSPSSPPNNLPKKSSIESPETGSRGVGGIPHNNNRKKIDGRMNVTEIHGGAGGRVRHPITPYPAVPTIRPFVAKKVTPQRPQQQQQGYNAGSENAEASMQLRTKIEPSGGLRQHFLDRQVLQRNRTVEPSQAVSSNDKVSTEMSTEPVTSSLNYKLRSPLRKLKRPHGKVESSQIETIAAPAAQVDKVRVTENNENLSSTSIVGEDTMDLGNDGESGPAVMGQTLYNKEPQFLGHRRRVKSRIRISTTPGSIITETTSTPPSTPSTTFPDNFNSATGVYSTGNDDEKISSQPADMFALPPPPATTQVITESITEQIPPGSFQTPIQSVPSESYMIESIGESDVLNMNTEHSFNKNSMDHKSFYPVSSPPPLQKHPGAAHADESLEVEPPTPLPSPSTSERPAVVKVFKHSHQSRPRPSSSSAGVTEPSLRSPPIRTISQYSRIRMTKTNGEESKKGDELREQSVLMRSNSSVVVGGGGDLSGSRRFTIPTHLFHSGSGQGVNGNENSGDDRERHSSTFSSSSDSQSGPSSRIRGRESQQSQQLQSDNYDLILDKEKRKFMQIPQQQHQDGRNWGNSNPQSQNVRSSTNPKSAGGMRVNSVGTQQQPFYHTFDRFQSTRHILEPITDLHEESRIHQTFVQRGDASDDTRGQQRQSYLKPFSSSSSKGGIGSPSSYVDNAPVRSVISRPQPSTAEPLRKRLRQRVKSPTFTPSTTPLPTTTTTMTTTTTTTPESIQEHSYDSDVLTPSKNYDDNFMTVIQFNSTHHNIGESSRGGGATGETFSSRPQTTTTPKSTFVFPAFKQEAKTVTPPTMSYHYPAENPSSAPAAGFNENSYTKNNKDQHFQTETHLRDGNSGISSSGWVVSSPFPVRESPSTNVQSSSGGTQEERDSHYEPEFTSERFTSAVSQTQKKKNQHDDDGMTYHPGAQPSRLQFPGLENNRGEESGSLNRAPVGVQGGGETTSSYHIHQNAVPTSPPATLAVQQKFQQVLNSQTPTTVGSYEGVNLGNDNRPSGILRVKSRANNTRFSVPKTFTFPTSPPSKSIAESSHKNSNTLDVQRGNAGPDTNVRLTGTRLGGLQQQQQVPAAARPTSTGNRLVVGGGGENPSQVNSKGNSLRTQQHHRGYGESNNSPGLGFNKEIPTTTTTTTGGFSFHLETPQGGKTGEINTLHKLKGQEQQYQDVPRESLHPHSPPMSSPSLYSSEQNQNGYQVQTGVAVSSPPSHNPGVDDTPHRPPPLHQDNNVHSYPPPSSLQNTLTTFKDSESGKYQKTVPTLLSMTHNGIPPASLPPVRPQPQSESFSQGTPGFSISFSTLPDGIKVHDTYPTQFIPQVHYPSPSPPPPPPSSLKISGAPPTMAHIKENDFIPQHDPTLSTASPSPAPLPYSQGMSGPVGYTQQGGYSASSPLYPHQQPSSGNNHPQYPMGSPLLKKLPPNRIQTHNGPQRPLEQSPPSKPTHYSRPTHYQQQQSQQAYKPQVDFHGGSSYQPLVGSSSTHRQVYQQHMSIPDNIISQLRGSMRNSRATNFSDLPPMESNVIETVAEPEQLVEMTGSNTSAPINSMRSDLLSPESTQESTKNGSRNEDNESVSLEMSSSVLHSENMEMTQGTLTSSQPSQGNVEEDRLAGNANIAIAELMNGESEQQSRSIGFKDPEVILGGFIPILPYSEEDPGPIYVKMQKSFNSDNLSLF